MKKWRIFRVARNVGHGGFLLPLDLGKVCRGNKFGRWSHCRNRFVFLATTGMSVKFHRRSSFARSVMEHTARSDSTRRGSATLHSLS